ncbi:hypothetical protein C347_04499 [Cryptococcus neoformans AD2-60a]|uniref:Uncharacterized protein n=2 Tax=Cryptococcus neoformans TaxID=5207 RepID=A0A854QA64_CRYNE|nr:hypothetical protein CNAG_03108 [Cryptococcus neoformans var. grubii H99]AUB26238.1 hypothetical protein CKF44_03108 [Cryptococcus neoformans var. grubii]OWZ30219.1 hypothetical protein C347_04499 [Cryptococcus neoformans var. grubii AD2-60a]OWZ38182.1 hypothetical protein C353_04352 [Cryptococcus neoformans var. grubii AD1-83a]OXC83468.1 hypothetical protein C344_04182 [Cryptococcus neoformans var. grubii AD1-7a]OXG17670.1 hypothetical protein C361_04659 [Cryptococcus neoformans var. grubi|eukprot:XP_012051031.1 hypothetical protein CNAG_03108 [Cryptococcus neoformans var. grubii H99]
MALSSLADELATAFDNGSTTSNSLAAEFGLDLDLDQELGLQTRAGGDGLGYRGHSLEEELAQGGFGQSPLPDRGLLNFDASPPAWSQHLLGGHSLEDEPALGEGICPPLSPLLTRCDHYNRGSSPSSIFSSHGIQQFNLDDHDELHERQLHGPLSSRNEQLDDHDKDLSLHDNLVSSSSKLLTSPSRPFIPQEPLSTLTTTPLRLGTGIHRNPSTRPISYPFSSPSPSSSSISYGSRRLTREDQDPLLMLSETIAMNSRFINSLRHLDEVPGTIASGTPSRTPGKIARATPGLVPGGLSGASILKPEVAEPEFPFTYLSPPSRATTSTSIPLAIDIHLQNHLAALEESEKKRDDQLRGLSLLAREFEGLRWGNGLIENGEWDRFVEKQGEMGVLEEENESGDVSALEADGEESLEDVPSSNLTPSTPIRHPYAAQFYSSPSPLSPQSTLQPTLQTLLSTSHSLTTSLNNLSDSLHNSASLSTQISRQLKNLRASVGGFREREVREEEARKGVEEWERGRVELGLGGGRIESAAIGSTKTESVQMTQRGRERVKSVRKVLEEECEEFKSKLEEYGKQVEKIQASRSAGTGILARG